MDARVEELEKAFHEALDELVEHTKGLLTCSCGGVRLWPTFRCSTCAQRSALVRAYYGWSR